MCQITHKEHLTTRHIVFRYFFLVAKHFRPTRSFGRHEQHPFSIVSTVGFQAYGSIRLLNRLSE